MSSRQGSRKVKFDAKTILEHLQPETKGYWETADYWRTRRQIQEKASTRELIAALEETDSAADRCELCYIIGRRCDRREAVPLLIKHLRDRDDHVCTEAAVALGNIGDASAGPALLARFSKPGKCSRYMLAYALGAVGYRPAIPQLIEALEDTGLRDSAALALGELGAVEAESSLRQALSQETASESESSRKLIQRGLGAVEMVVTTLNSGDVTLVLPTLIEALDNPDPIFAGAATWALGNVGGQRAAEVLQDALTRHRNARNKCGLLQRIQEALVLIETRGSTL